MKKTIFFRILQGFILILVLNALVIFVLTFDTVKSNHKVYTAKNLEKLSSTLLLKIRPLWVENNFDEISKITEVHSKIIQARITIIDKTGQVLVDTEEDPKKMPNHRNRKEVADALNGKVSTSERKSSTVDQDMIYLASPCEVNGEIIGVIRLSVFLSDIDLLLNKLGLEIVRVIIVTILISLILAFFFTRSVSKPVKELVTGSQKVAAGDFDVRILLKNKDEFKIIADSFNDMVTKIKNLFDELSHQKDELNTIVSSIQEGLLVIDCDGKVQHQNNSLFEQFNLKFKTGEPYWETFRNANFDNIITHVKKQKTNLYENIEIEEKIVLCSATYLEKTSVIIVLFSDITELRRLERFRKDLVINVSHELKTPLTAIKGFTETLIEDEELKNQHYIEIIKRHTDRLINIVNDLLTLSNLENNLELQLESINFKELIENLLIIFEQRVKAKNLTVELDIPEELPNIQADKFKLEQMFINLIDNSIKYTEKGGIKISVRKIDETVEIKMVDTGVGIPQADLSRIFERFYVVDKSRARKLGGTGLGLSIVKHIVLLHQGTITIESPNFSDTTSSEKTAENSGTTFTINLPN